MNGRGGWNLFGRLIPLPGARRRRPIRSLLNYYHLALYRVDETFLGETNLGQTWHRAGNGQKE